MRSATTLPDLWLRRLSYSALFALLQPVVMLYLLWRARKQPAYLQHWSQRFLAAIPALPNAPPNTPYIWLHAVSVGETRAAASLVQALLQEYPHHHFILTHTTPTGLATSQELFGNEARITRMYLPYDLPWLVSRFLHRIKPELGVLMETEVWPNWVQGCRTQQVPLLLVNARLSQKTLQQVQRSALLTRSYQRLTAVLAQTTLDQQRFAALGVDAEVFGNLKFDQATTIDHALLTHLRSLSANRPILLCASTREGEEEMLLESFLSLRNSLPINTLWTIVPRHPQRFDEVEQLLSSDGLKVARRSRNDSAATVDVWLIDSMGELATLYALAQVALIGGSLRPLGGQNLLEALAQGCPVIIGPHTLNFEEICVHAVDAGVAIRVQSAAEAWQRMIELLNDPSRQQMSDAAKAFIATHQGATARTIARLVEIIRNADCFEP